MNEWRNTDQIISSHQLTQSGLLSAISRFYSTFFSSSPTLLQSLSLQNSLSTRDQLKSVLNVSLKLSTKHLFSSLTSDPLSLSPSSSESKQVTHIRSCCNPEATDALPLSSSRNLPGSTHVNVMYASASCPAFSREVDRLR
ncbi:hypothetical protein DPMN_166479 [Dreissena polymorpha]|uniref:Uncharacterized protein n=1 Tax=Dreissena polymorpha TaxID=45954 RepID=A0A9D4F2M0_DREPO|nr:hypothetical protein DPMN_166479 [Dreissena polymorpha]